MKSFRIACATALMVFTLSFTTLADDGWIGTGFAPPPPPIENPTTEADTSSAEVAQGQESTALDFALEVSLSVFESIQSLY